MVMEMVIKIDKQGRLVLPKEIRDKYHLIHDVELVVTEVADGIKLSPRKEKRSLRKIFDEAPEFDPKNEIVIDVANYDEDEA
jgi:AbrB family looped-hinge helix DNA binding protein